MPDASAHRHTFPRRVRLRGRNAFSAVFAAKARKNAGPLSVVGKPNGLDHCRFGISIGRRVGNAPRRNRIKRLLREAFRLMQHDWPAGYDLVCIVRPHEPLTLAEYQRLLFSAVRGIHQTWRRRAGNPENPKAGKPES